MRGKRAPLLSPCKGEMEAHFGGKACYCCVVLGVGCGNLGSPEEVTSHSRVRDRIGLFLQ